MKCKKELEKLSPIKKTEKFECHRVADKGFVDCKNISITALTEEKIREWEDILIEEIFRNL